MTLCIKCVMPKSLLYISLDSYLSPQKLCYWNSLGCLVSYAHNLPFCMCVNVDRKWSPSGSILIRAEGVGGIGWMKRSHHGTRDPRASKFNFKIFFFLTIYIFFEIQTKSEYRSVECQIAVSGNWEKKKSWIADRCPSWAAHRCVHMLVHMRTSLILIFFFAYILFLIIAFWCSIGSYQYTILSTVRVNLVFCPCRIAAVTLPLAGCIEKIYGVTTETETSCQEAVTCKTDFVF